MIDPIANVLNPREAANQSRQPAAPAAPPAPTPDTNLTPDQRVEIMQAAVEKLIKKSLPSNSKLQVEKDKELGTFIYRSINPDTGEIIRQWPPEQLLALREYLKEMEGVLVDTKA
jgi:flagellar protein FlaG